MGFFLLVGCFVFSFPPSGSFPLLGKSFLSVFFTGVAIMLSSPEPEIRICTWKICRIACPCKEKLGHLDKNKKEREKNKERP